MIRKEDFDCVPDELQDIMGYESAKKIAKAEYLRYLRSERWEDIRKLALRRDDFHCRDCGSPHKLQVHHLRYRYVNFHPENYIEARANMREELGDVITLCERCHKKRHGLLKEIRIREVGRGLGAYAIMEVING